MIDGCDGILEGITPVSGLVESSNHLSSCS
jgi:hypothetical protein